VRALAAQSALPKFKLLDYSQHALGKGASARAASYIQIKTERGRAYFGVGIHTSIELASIKAVVSALNRAAAYDVKSLPRVSQTRPWADLSGAVGAIPAFPRR